MPVFEPGKILEVILPTDQGKPNPATFQVRALSARESIELEGRMAEAVKDKGDREQLQAIASILEEFIVGWEGLHLPYAPGTLLDVLGARDIVRLDMAIRWQFGVQEKKG
jgi:hypothetical protein